MLQSYTGGGTLFKLNFLVVYNSIIGGTNKSATVTQKFLSSIKKEADIPNMDWCSYIITCLKRTKEEWSATEPYNGPLIFLAVLYAHEQQLRRAPEKAITPAIRYVTTGVLVDLEGCMHDDGPCLNGNIQEGSQLTKNDELQTHIESAEGQNDEGQTDFYQNVSVMQEKEDEVQHQIDEGQTDIDQYVNVPQDEEDEDVVMLEPKQETPELVENVSHMSDSVEKFSSCQCGIIVCVEGYKVKQSVVGILKAILKEHGDIAAKCILKTDFMRSLILEGVCEVAMRIQANDFTEKMEEIESRVLDAKVVNLDVSWLEAHIQKRKEATEMYNLLMKKKGDHILAKNAARINLRKRQAELAAAEERSREAKRRVGVLRLVGKNLTENFFESKAKMDSWVMNPIV